jgi:hypothetical protein
VSTDRRRGPQPDPNHRERPSLDTNAENPTRGVKAESGGNTNESDSGDEPKAAFSQSSDDTRGSDGPDGGGDWNKQQKRVFQRVNTLLNYWESRDYSILWLTFTSSPESKPANELSYSHQRLRQRVERARLAYCDGDGCPDHDEPTGHHLGHIDELEHCQIRTCEGPQGVIHTFWAWDRSRFRDGSHDRELYIPQNWLSEQWLDIHGSEVPLEPGELEIWPEGAVGHMERLTRDRGPFIVDVRRYGPEHTDGEHSAEAVASYAASQYLGEHGEALEHLGWSNQRSIGGPLAEVWDKLKGWCGTIEAAVKVWKRVISGERVSLSDDSGNGINYEIVVEPPPNLSVEQSADVTPPEDYEPGGTDGETRVESYSDGSREFEEPRWWGTDFRVTADRETGAVYVEPDPAAWARREEDPERSDTHTRHFRRRVVGTDQETLSRSVSLGAWKTRQHGLSDWWGEE